MGKKTMQMESVETSAGSAICAAPSRIPCCSGWPSSRCREIFSMVTVASSTRMPSQAAQRHQVDSLMQEAEDNDGTQDGQRNRNAYDHGAPPASQEHQDHQRS